jgi:hypothetical protein
MRLAFVYCPECLKGKEEASAVYVIPTGDVLTHKRMCDTHGEITLKVLAVLLADPDDL